jgi:hypothetical protein
LAEAAEKLKKEIPDITVHILQLYDCFDPDVADAG